MKIKIGNNNKIKNSNIGSNVTGDFKKENKFIHIIIEIFIGLVIAGIVFLLNWN